MNGRGNNRAENGRALKRKYRAKMSSWIWLYRDELQTGFLNQTGTDRNGFILTGLDVLADDRQEKNGK